MWNFVKLPDETGEQTLRVSSERFPWLCYSRVRALSVRYVRDPGKLRRPFKVSIPNRRTVHTNTRWIASVREIRHDEASFVRSLVRQSTTYRQSRRLKSRRLVGLKNKLLERESLLVSSPERPSKQPNRKKEAGPRSNISVTMHSPPLGVHVACGGKYHAVETTLSASTVSSQVRIIRLVSSPVQQGWLYHQNENNPVAWSFRSRKINREFLSLKPAFWAQRRRILRCPIFGSDVYDNHTCSV